MATHDTPRKAFRFFREHLLSGEPFTYQELANVTGWSSNTIATYVTKHWREVIERKARGKFIVKPAFEYVSENRFLSTFTQSRKFFVKYERAKYEEIVQYEFLLPLTHEGQLHKALDGLFYEDTIRRRLIDIGLEQVRKWIGRDDRESPEDYIRRVYQVVSNRFGGYSISHVSGRYLAGDLTTRAKAAEMLEKEEPYIIDETTAVVRFIIPLETTMSFNKSDFDKPEGNGESAISTATADEISLVRWLFFNVFAEAIVRTVEGEDVIWLIEETPRKRQLYVWRKEGTAKKQKDIYSTGDLFSIK